MAEKLARPAGPSLGKPQEFHKLPMPERLIIAGASVRAAAQSAVRSGLLVTAADLFCDRDLAECSQAHRVANYPRGILDITRRIPPAEWMYTGGLENEPDLVDAVSRRHALLGHGGCVLRQVRDPWQLAQALAHAEADVSSSPAATTRDRRRQVAAQTAAELRRPANSLV